MSNSRNPNSLRLGILSFGGAGQAQLSHFLSMKGCEVAAIFDPAEDARVRALKRVPKVLVTGNLDEMLSKVDAVAVCSPDSTHASYMARCLEAGKHVVCEKPLTDSVQGYEEILDAEKRHPGLICSVQHQMRFVPVHLKMKELIRRKALGQISYIEGYYVHNLRERSSAHHNWRFTDNATLMVYAGCHFVDLFRWLLDDEVVEVTAMANHLAFPEYPESDLNAILLRFRSGVIAKMVVAFGAGRPQDHTVRVYGDKASIENNLLFHEDGRFEMIARPKLGTFRGYTRFPPAKALMWLNDLKTCSIGLAMELLMRLQGQSHPFYGVSSYPMRLYEHGIAVNDSLRDFVECVQTGRAPLVGLKDSARTVATCLAGLEAFRTSRVVQVKDFWSPCLDD